MPSRWKNWVVRSAEWTCLIDLLQHAPDHDAPVYVLAYHRIGQLGSPSLLDPDLISATAEQLYEQMQFIARRYHPVSPDQVLASLEHNTRLPRDAVLVTVDDGYRDFRSSFFPIASEFGIRPILFVATAYPGNESGYWWDRLFRAVHWPRSPEISTPVGTVRVKTEEEKARANDRLRDHMRRVAFEQVLAETGALEDGAAVEARNASSSVLEWDELRRLARDGVTIAAHTHNHPILTRVSLDRARWEIRQAQDRIRSEIGSALPIFAFPDGQPHSFNEELFRLLGEEGFKLAFTTVEGCAHLGSDNLLGLPRVNVSPHMDLARFHLHMTPFYDRWIRWKK